jgi:PAT family beta-lactamase induction signal transducer AmpG
MDEKIPYASAIATAGWYSGYAFIGGTLALWLGGETMGLEWHQVYQALTGFVLLLMLAVILSPEPLEQEAKEKQYDSDGVEKGPGTWLQETVLIPFTEFFLRCFLYFLCSSFLSGWVKQCSVVCRWCFM